MIMTEAKYKVSLEDVKKYFKSIKLDVCYGFNYDKTSINKYSNETKQNLCRSSDLTYDELYKLIMQNSDYDILIPLDYGIFQFYIEKSGNQITKIVYCYYSNSRNFDELTKENEETKEPNVRYSDFFQFIVDDAPLKDNIVYFRYDFDPSIYNGIIHSASHLHIGWGNEIRIPIINLMTPEIFVDFVIKNIYKDKWQVSINDKNFKKKILSLKRQTEILKKDFFNEEEKSILHIS